MWVLSSDGDLLKGKRHWLKPGKKYLFGRVRKDNSIAVIDSATVSRQHLTIEVLPVKADYYSRLNKRSRVVITDLKTKCGSKIDGERFNDQAVNLQGDGPFLLQIGRCRELFTIQWVNVALSVDVASVLPDSSSEIPSRRGRHIDSDPRWVDLRDKVLPADVKLIREFIAQTTTHVVQTKRLSDWTLQALLSSKHIIAPSFIDAIAYNTTPHDKNDPNSTCPLEEDFDGSFPLPEFYLPGPSTGGRDLPEKALLPNIKRENLFQGYTIIFAEEKRFLEFLPIITTGHGKALLFDNGQAHVTGREIVNYMQSIASRKNITLDEHSKIALFELDKGNAERSNWAEKVEAEVMKMTGLKPVNPDMLLNSVIKSDASVLIQAAPPEEKIGETPEPEPEPVLEDHPEPLASHQENSEMSREVPMQSRSKRPREIDSEPMPPPKKPGRIPISQQQIQFQSQSDIPPSKRPRVREFTSRVNTFTLDDDEEFASAPSDDEDEQEAMLDAIPETPIAEPADVITSREKPAAAEALPEPEETSLLEEGVTALLPGAEAMKTHIITEKQRQGLRSQSRLSQRSSDEQSQHDEGIVETPPKMKTRATPGKRALAPTPTKSKDQAGSPRRSKRQKTAAANPEDEEMIRAARQRREEQDREAEARRHEEESPFIRGLHSQQSHHHEQNKSGDGSADTKNDQSTHLVQPTDEDLGVTLEEIQRLVIVEDMDIPARSKPRHPQTDGDEERMAQWTGRPNYKGFRRAKRVGRQPGSARDEVDNNSRTTAKPKISLVEVKTHEMLPGEVHWEEERIGQPRGRSNAGEATNFDRGRRYQNNNNNGEEEDEQADYAGDNSITTRGGDGSHSTSSRRGVSSNFEPQTTPAGPGWGSLRRDGGGSRASTTPMQVDDDDEEEESFRW